MRPGDFPLGVIDLNEDDGFAKGGHVRPGSIARLDLVPTSSSHCCCCFIDTVRRGDGFGGVVKVMGKVTCLVGPGIASLGYHVL